MADLTIDPLTVRPIEVIEQITLPSNAVCDRGEPVYLNTTTGKLERGNAGAAGTADIVGVAMTKTTPAGMPSTVIRKGTVHLGAALDALAFGATVYLSNTTGKLADAAGTVSVVIGKVVPIFARADGLADKALRIDR
jgi:hypothetical protein